MCRRLPVGKALPLQQVLKDPKQFHVIWRLVSPNFYPISDSQLSDSGFDENLECFELPFLG